ncbi:unnamed protein product [Cylicocyclus nassatus]|uniref:C-type lectin domain-containing protein n=1 Tax=Cylicocyclus nassatus TaxID=53992 RepID=A0AA36M6U7_CYLNA|nr:unnamed protein product [Cylicocyclus nassatus]
MCTIKLLLFTLISLTEGSINPKSNEEFSRSSVQSPGLPYLNSSNAECPGHCESGWTYFSETDACYKTFHWETFYSAESRCRNFGAHLASIHNADENHFVADLTDTAIEWHYENTDAHVHGSTWIGLRWADYSNSEDWLWTDGTKAEFLAWAPNEPSGGNERCVELLSDRMVEPERALWYHKWNDMPCSDKIRSYVCKKPALH